MLYAVLEEEQRAIVEVQQYPHTVALAVVTTVIFAILTVAVEGTQASADKPTVGAIPEEPGNVWSQVGPSDADGMECSRR
jgi:hypothetical protein